MHVIQYVASVIAMVMLGPIQSDLQTRSHRTSVLFTITGGQP